MLSEIAINKIKSLAAKYRPDFEPGEYWDSGNFDDAFERGVSCGENYIFQEIAEILKEDGEQ